MLNLALAMNMKLAFILVLALSMGMTYGAEPTNAIPDPDKIEVELGYAEALSRLGMREHAESVLARIQETNDVRVIKTKFVTFLQHGFIRPRQIDRYIAEHSVSNSPAYWVLKVTQADAYWAWGKTNECTAIYDSFMREFPRLIGTEPEDGQPDAREYSPKAADGPRRNPQR